jgi:hypothetical protein
MYIIILYKTIMSTGYSHQQWEPVVLNKTNNKTKTTSIVSKTQGSIQGKLIVDDNDDVYRKTTKAFVREKINELIKIRTNKQLTQVQLCQNLALPKGTISDVEQGKEVSLGCYNKIQSYITKNRIEESKPESPK